MISKRRSRRILVGLIACAIVCIGLSLPTYFIQGGFNLEAQHIDAE
jgi:hypothetical protein